MSVMPELLPFLNSITALESPVDEVEEKRPSGLVIQTQVSDDRAVRRGVILRVAPTFFPVDAELVDRLRPGTVVYFKEATRIGDVVVVSFREIIAYEEEPGDA